MKRALLILTAVSVAMLTSCAKKEASPADAPHATVSMRDGTAVSGKVLQSSASEIKLLGDDNVTRTIPMTQVKSVDYGEAAPAAGEQAQTPAAPPATAPPAASAPSGAAPRQQPPAGQQQLARREPPPTQAAITTKTYEVPAGTKVAVRAEEPIDSSKASPGQTYSASVVSDVLDADGNVVVPRGANAKLVIRQSAENAKDLSLGLQSVVVGGQRYELSATDIEKGRKDSIGANKRTATYVGGAAAVGAVIGAIAGGGKGAAIGAGSGAGAGALAQVLTRGSSIKVPVESELTFQLNQRLRVVAR
jgi:outer membrane lipoprotein SlyB